MSRNDISPSLVLGRREFLQGLSAGILMLLTLPQAEAQESGRGGFRGRPEPQNIGAWLHIDQKGQITVYTGKVEVGQNIRTSLTQAVAEELLVPVASIQLIMGDTALTPYDMGTFGSRTTPTMSPQLRRAAAAARELLLGLAAKEWGAVPASLKAENGKIIEASSSRSIGYGELLKGQKITRTIPADIALTSDTDWKVMGTSVPKVDGRDFVTGRHHYTPDITVKGMLYGKVLRPPGFHAVLKSLDTKAALALPGVVVTSNGNFIGVAAPTEPMARKALQLLQAEWTPMPNPPAESDLFTILRGGSAPPAASPAATADTQSLNATYTVAYIAHTPLEPRAALAEWEGDHLTVWTGTQRPFGVQQDLAEAFHIPEEKVRVIMPDTGSGYGGKHTGEAAIEAATIAKAAGKPVKLVWNREEEFTWAYFRPAGVIDISAAVQNDGTIVQWSQDNYNSGPSALRSPYNIPNQQANFHPAPSPLRQGSYRGLAGTANHFARESHMDDLARLLKMDPMAFRLKNITDERLKAILLAVTAQFGWEKRTPTPGHGFGLAIGTEKGSYTATCVEVIADRATGTVKVTRITTAFECGAIVNPNHLKNQVEGAAVMGLGGALFEAIHFGNDTITNPTLVDYRVPRFGDVPEIEVVLLDRKDIPSAGAGETPIMTISPALRNAILDAAGVPLRSMPMIPAGLKA